MSVQGCIATPFGKWAAHLTRMAVISRNHSEVAAVRNRRRGAHHGSRSTPRCFAKSHFPFAGAVDEVAVITEYLLSMPFAHPQRGEVCVPNFINAAFSTLGKGLTILMRLRDSLHRLPPVAPITHHISQGRSAKYRELQCPCCAYNGDKSLLSTADASPLLIHHAVNDLPALCFKPRGCQIPILHLS